jgi:hypothetical protein
MSSVAPEKQTASRLPSRVILQASSPDQIQAEVRDPFSMGWDAGDDLEDPPPCPFKDGLSARLWRQGFAARVDAYIAKRRSAGGLNVSLT